tara:strand:+ start:1042 stop:1794 length:753 start_codon:yes stop_codon:yes gene_type:complete
MAIIRNISTGNTFQQHVTTTAETVQKLNHLTDGTINDKFYANTDVVVDGNLDVTGNISLDAAGFDNLTMNGNLILSQSDSVLYKEAAYTSGEASARYVITGNGLAYRFTTFGESPRDNPSLYFKAGSTYAFDLTGLAGGHPFVIRTTNEPSTVNDGGTYMNVGLTHVETANDGNRVIVTQGFNAQRKKNGILYMQIPAGTANFGDQYYYQCTAHAGAMVGSITVENTVQAAFERANSTVSDAVALSIALS